MSSLQKCFQMDGNSIYSTNATPKSNLLEQQSFSRWYISQWLRLSWRKILLASQFLCILLSAFSHTSTLPTWETLTLCRSTLCQSCWLLSQWSKRWIHPLLDSQWLEWLLLYSLTHTSQWNTKLLVKSLNSTISSSSPKRAGLNPPSTTQTTWDSKFLHQFSFSPKSSWQWLEL